MLPLSSLPLFVRAKTAFVNKVATSTFDFIDGNENAVEHTYTQLLQDAVTVAQSLLSLVCVTDLEERRVGVLAPPGYTFVASLWGIWLSGGVAVPLCTSHPAPEIAYVLSDSSCDIVISHSTPFKNVIEAALKLNGCNCRHTQLESILSLALPSGKCLLSSHPATTNDWISNDSSTCHLMSRRCLILYTSGTTGRPKGVVHTHASLNAQANSLEKAWEWSSNDCILNVLPLHHIHGLINIVYCALMCGATLELNVGKFSASGWYNRILTLPSITLFMAVPTVYSKLLTQLETMSDDERQLVSIALQKLRLMVSGSAALSLSILNRWTTVSSHILLERYGMTEIGMALSNPLRGDRHAGWVGFPLPSVETKIDTSTRMEINFDEMTDGSMDGDCECGELLIGGPTIFKEYWCKPEVTAASMTADGYFRTGDIVMRRRRDGCFKIVGRENQDIIKSGGYKISSLEIEQKISEHADVESVSIVGVADLEWGEVVAAVIVPKNGRPPITVSNLRQWLRALIAPYKMPSRLICLETMPVNAMGKVEKKKLKELFL